MHRVRKRRGLAVVRELWLTRDRIAERRDTSPGRVLPDGVIVELANLAPTTVQELTETRELRPARRNAKVWLDAIRRAQNLPESILPPLALPGTGPPPARAWAEREPVAAARLIQARAELAAFGAQHLVPVENLLTPDALRRLLWAPPADLSEAGIAAALSAFGARPWQVAITAPIIARACADHP
jgi:ribonuclease D